MTFTNSILGGTTLARTDIRSEGFVTGVTGWIIRRDGTAEFSSVTIRGDVLVGNYPTGNYVAIRHTYAVDQAFPRVVFGTTLSETEDGYIGEFIATGLPVLQYQSGNLGGGCVNVSYVAASADGTSSKPLVLYTLADPSGALVAGDALLRLNNYFRFQVDGPVTDVTLASTNHPFQLGATTGPNIAADSNEIQARNNGATATLFLNNDGGGIISTDMRHIDDYVLAAVSTASTTYVALGGDDLSLTLPYPPSGTVSVSIRMASQNNVINTFAIMSFEIRDTNSAGTLRTAAADDRAIFSLSPIINALTGITSLTDVITGLPTSGTMFIRAMYRSNAALNTAQFLFRGLVVQPSP